MKTETIIIILAACTLFVALLTFLASITSWFRKTISLQFGFLLNDKIVNKLDISTGDLAKPIVLRFHNSGKTTLIGTVLDIRFLKPLSLSGTQKALSKIPGKTIHGRTPDKSLYLIRYSELDIAGHDNMDFRVELNTRGAKPGTYKVIVTAYPTQQNYKYKKSELDIVMR